MKVLIVDDEPLARNRLVRLVTQQSGFEVIAEAGNGQQAIEACQQHSPDVVLMDIRMPVMDGLQAARQIAEAEQPPAVIFCTAYNDYALQAFEAQAVDYLLKPVNRDKLGEALAKASRLNRVQLQALKEQEGSAVPEQRNHISAKTSRGIELVPLESVRYFLADHKYVTVFYLQEGQLREVLIDEPLKELEVELSESFTRIHRNALVSIHHIQGLEKTAQATLIKLDGVKHGPQVSRRHLPELRKLLQAL